MPYHPREDPVVPPPSTQPPQATDDLTPAHSLTGGPEAAAGATVDYTGGESASQSADLPADLAAAFGDRFTLERAKK